MENKTTKPQLSGVFSLLTATFIYGFFGILSRLIGFSIPLYYQSGIRAIAAALMISFLLIFLKQWQLVGKRDLLWIIARSFFGIVAIVAFFVAVNFLQIGTVYFIFYAGSTLGGYALGKFLFSETLTPTKIVSLILSLLGLYLIYSLSVDTSKALYALISLVSGVATAFWNTLSKKISHSYSALQLSFLDNLIGGLMALTISALFIREQWTFPTASLSWGLNFLFACFYIATGQLVIYGFRRLDAQVGSLIMLAEVIFGIVLGLIFYKEIITLPALLGGLLIVVGIVLPELNGLKNQKVVAKILRWRSSD